MNKASSTLTLIGAVAAMTLLAACGGGGAPAEDDSPEGQAYLYRHSVMELVARKNAVLGGMARGEVPDDEALFRKSAADLVVLAGMIDEGFEQEGIAPGSRAMPEIWSNMGDF
jgi:cytochrome c556